MPIRSTGRTAGWLAGLLLAALAGCGTDGATIFESAAPPSAEATFGGCVFCHRDLAEKMTASGGHESLDLKCEFCHDDLTPGEVGPGHRSIPTCADCHLEQATHRDPAAGTPEECVVCHTPHGSDNLFLVNEVVSTPASGDRPVEFTALLGVADGGLASSTDPGTGLCETCHTQTRYFRGDGSGDDHFPFTCFTCHPHGAGFAPR
jgi:predicted CXXCH cytochrome family protein